jgi:hypothetical protein
MSFPGEASELNVFVSCREKWKNKRRTSSARPGNSQSSVISFQAAASGFVAAGCCQGINGAVSSSL